MVGLARHRPLPDFLHGVVIISLLYLIIWGKNRGERLFLLTIKAEKMEGNYNVFFDSSRKTR